MRVPLVLTLVLVAAVATAHAASRSPATTEVVRWSPFDPSGKVKKTITVKFLGTGRCGDAYSIAGAMAYRCVKRNVIYEPCWRDGAGRTDFVLCIRDTWTRVAFKLLSPDLLLYPGFTALSAHGEPGEPPFAIELNTGERCAVYRGAGNSIRRAGHEFAIEYYCNGDLVLLNDWRGRSFHQIRTARSGRSGYQLAGYRTILRAYFGGLPPAMQHQQNVAHQVLIAAQRLIKRTDPHADVDGPAVRLTLPDMRWAYVIFSAISGNNFALLHRIGTRWLDASSYRPYCEKLPKRVREQLFFRRRTREALPVAWHETVC